MIFVLCYNKFSILDYRTWLAPFIRFVTYFKRKGLNGESIKWHHNAIINGSEAIEALANGVVKHSTVNLSHYEHRKYLIPTFEYDEKLAWEWLCGQEGVKYNFFLVCFVKLIYQISGVWILKKEPKKIDCAYLVAKMYYISTNGTIKDEFKDYVKFDPQDFVRLWKKGLFYEI